MAKKSSSNSPIRVFKDGETFTLKEKNSFLPVRASHEIEVIKVDGGVIPGNITHQLKCDYLIYDASFKKSRFIELKGTDVGHGFEQIFATILFFEQGERFKCWVEKLEEMTGYIVSPRFQVPDIISSKQKIVCRKMYDKSRKKQKNFLDHIIFIKCVPKANAHNDAKTNCRLVSPEQPLLV